MKREIFYVLTLVKGGRLQLNVLKGEDTQGCLIEAPFEKAFFESQEMVWESIPGTILQTFVIITNFKEREWSQMFSLLASVAAVGSISSRTSYVMDISANNREKAGNLYGFVPNSNVLRLVIQGAMISLSCSQLLSRSLGYALLAASAGKTVAALEAVAEISIFLLYKLALRDFYHHGLANNGMLRLFGAIFLRIFCNKILADFTANMGLRSPNEMGGLYLTVNLFLSQAFLWGSIMIYNDTMIADGLTEQQLLLMGRLLLTVWGLAVCAFISTCKREYWHTFISLATTSSYAKACWDWQM
jgi:hypothetical protein